MVVPGGGRRFAQELVKRRAGRVDCSPPEEQPLGRHWALAASEATKSVHTWLIVCRTSLVKECVLGTVYYVDICLGALVGGSDAEGSWKVWRKHS